MDQRRRTLAASSSSAPTVPSSIPRPRQSLAPSSSTQNMRQSLAPTRAQSSINLGAASRMSIAPGGSQESQGFSQGHGGLERREPPATVGRSTNLYSSMGAMSVSRPGVLRGMDYPASERRTSTYGGRRQTSAFSTSTPLSSGTLSRSGPPLKDTRDFKSPETRKRYATEIVLFLTQRNFVGPGASGPATEKQLLQPTGVQFQSFFKFIIGEFDPSVRWTGEFEKSVVPVLQGCLYPFAGSISKSHLQSIGSQQSWPNMLAMLHWLVESIQLREETFDTSPTLHIPEPPYEGDTREFDHTEATFASWIDFTTLCYPKFLAADEFDSGEELEEFFNRLEEGRIRLRNRVSELEEQADTLKKSWDSLVAQPDPLVKIREEYTKCSNDMVKMKAYMTGLENKRTSQKSHMKIALGKKETLRKERDETHSRIHQLTNLIAGQGMTPLEIQSITAERLTLSTTHRTILTRASTKYNSILSLEVSLSKSLLSASSLTSTYLSLAESLLLLPHPPPGFEHVNFELEVNGAGEVPCPGVEEVGMVRGAVGELRGRTRSEVAGRNGEKVEVEE
ncbi:kinetochore protein NDC80, partial [Phenoliferia sp. Uapishka_3]